MTVGVGDLFVLDLKQSERANGRQSMSSEPDLPRPSVRPIVSEGLAPGGGATSSDLRPRATVDIDTRACALDLACEHQLAVARTGEVTRRSRRGAKAGGSMAGR